jgi:HNH endonuclease
MGTYIPENLRQKIRNTDRDRCCYCLTTELNSGIRLTFDHTTPQAKQGKTTFENVCLACRSCNEFKSDTTEAIDPITDQTAPLFNPRTQNWSDHFAWIADGTKVQGKTAIGRVTVTTLQMNRSIIVLTRRRWVEVGWHPPED